MKINNKLALITGASSGIGAETARQLALKGATVILLARNSSNLNTVANKINLNDGKAHFFQIDLSDFNQIHRVTEVIKKEIGIPDIIFNNAGIGKWRFVEETSEKEALEMIKVPYLAAFAVTKAFMPEILERNSGYIINMSSFAGVYAFSGATAYTASRKAMMGFHEALTADLYHTKIRTAISYFAKVESTFWNNNPNSEVRLPGAQAMIPSITTKKAAFIIVKGIQRNRRKIRSPFVIHVIEFLTWLTPPITKLLLYQTGYRRKTI
jgi:uncharacterized protein